MEKLIKCNYEIINKNDIEKLSFAERDVFGISDVDTMVSIYSILVDINLRNLGIGTSVLKALCEKFKDELILFTSGLLTEVYPVEPEDEVFEIVLNEQEEFLIKNGFTSINEYVGYEYKRAYIYNGNDIGKATISKIQKEIDSNKSK